MLERGTGLEPLLAKPGYGDEISKACAGKSITQKGTYGRPKVSETEGSRGQGLRG